MPWFAPSPRPDPDAVHREAALELIRTLEVHLPEATRAAQQDLDSGVPPAAVISDLGRSLANLLSQQQERIHHLQGQVQTEEWRIQGLLQENDRLRNEPLRGELADAQAWAEVISGRLAESEGRLVTAHKALTASQAEVEELHAYILRQNHIIAQQQLRLNHLLGETPSAETGGEPS